MKISDICVAKGLKLKISCSDAGARLIVGALVEIEETGRELEFFVKMYGPESKGAPSSPILCKTDRMSASYIKELLDAEKNAGSRCLFSVENAEDSFAEIQAYTFRTVTEYKTAIAIQVSDELLQKTTAEKLYHEYVWNGLGVPALFCLNYKNRKKQKDSVRFFSGKRCLIAGNTIRGIIATSEVYSKDRDYLPLDIYVAPEIKFVPASQALDVDGSMAAELNKISDAQSYFARWEAYSELSKQLMEKETEDFGTLSYTSYSARSDLNGVTFEFSVNEEIDEIFKGRELCVEVTQGDKSISKPVGAIKKISHDCVATYFENVDSVDDLPEKGELKLFVVGDKIISARREVAKQRMIKNQSPIKYMVALIEAGASPYEHYSHWGTHGAVTTELIRNFKKADLLNPQQIRALDMAINTPDIALIQGPPGTGKTTVIKAICERFREIYEAEERQKKKMDPDHMIRSPKILISSFQNEAVDNAISTPLPGDIPAHRKTASRARGTTKEQYQRSLKKWYEGVRESVSSLIVDHAAAEFEKKQREMQDEFFAYKNTGENPTLAIDLIQHYLGFVEIKYPDWLVQKALAILKSAELDGSQDEPQSPIVPILKSQRITADSFSDDGKIQAKKLRAYLKIRGDVLLGEEEFSAIEAACGENMTENEFLRFSQTVAKLKKQYCTDEVKIDAKNRQVVNQCLNDMIMCFKNQYDKVLPDLESKKSRILSEFLSRLEQEYESLVKKYSMTTAATCQTCLDLNGDANAVYDLVVVDEAARANPLDLFIPMSMGRKIVLVGDHKQLPHMLEPDVLNAIKDDPKFKDLPAIEKSLFERLFEMFSKGQAPKAILLTHQFRMHPAICQFVSDSFYDGQLKTSEKITPELRSSPREINGGHPLAFLNVPFSKGAERGGTSKCRPIEAEVIAQEVKKILSFDSGRSVGVITFYAAQSALIRQKLELLLNAEQMEHVEIGTVDAFQGKEFDYVLLSCVRSNRPSKEGELPSVGFLEKPNRLCVAFSRAIRQLIVVGDAETLMQIPCFAKLYELCTQNGGCYREY